MRVAAGAIARKYLAQRLGVNIYGYLSKIGPLTLEPVQPSFAYENPFFCPDPARVKELEDLVWKIREEGDSIGARVTVVAAGVRRAWRTCVRPPGCGHCLRHDGHQRGKSRGDRRRHACRRAEGQRASRSAHAPRASESNNAGGVLGGISSGQDVVVHVSLKPTSSITVPGETINVAGETVDVVTTGRHDHP